MRALQSSSLYWQNPTYVSHQAVWLPIWRDISGTELLKCFLISVLTDSKDSVYFITVGKLFQMFCVFMKNECFNECV